MASIYCQELIRNSKTLCESYIGEILKRADKGKNNDKNENQDDEEVLLTYEDLYPKATDPKEDTLIDPVEEQDKKSEKIQNKLNENYYLEDDKKHLDILI